MKTRCSKLVRSLAVLGWAGWRKKRVIEAVTQAKRMGSPRWAIVWSSLWLVSCAHTNHYSEPALPQEAGAILEATIPVWIVSVDGEKVSGFGMRDRKRLRITPGSHVIEVAYAQHKPVVGVMPPPEEAAVPNLGETIAYVTQPHAIRFTSRPAKVSIGAERGRTYVISAQIEGSQWKPSVAEYETLSR